MYDVIVIGGGVAGCVSAYVLGRAGVKVLILEKEKLPRYKTCGGGVVYRAEEFIPFEIDLVIDRKFYSADIFDHQNKLRFKVERDHPVINMTMRENLDYYLLAKAVGNDAKFKDGIVVKDLILKDDEVEVLTDKDNFTAKFVIGADGATGISTKVLGLQQNFTKVPAIEHEIYVDENLFEQFGSTARFDFGIIPQGYCWVFPKKDHLSIGAASMVPGNINLKAYLGNYLKQLHIDKIEKEEKHGYIIPMRPKKKKFTEGRLLLAGDAAGLADPITAEGISYAVETGFHAARAFLKCDFEVSLVNEYYNFKLKQILKNLLRAKLLAYFVYSSPKLQKMIFKRYGQRLAELMTDVIMGTADYRDLVNNPVNYLKLLHPKFFGKQQLKELYDFQI